MGLSRRFGGRLHKRRDTSRQVCQACPMPARLLHRASLLPAFLLGFHFANVSAQELSPFARAHAAIKEFHTRFSEGKFKEIYAATDPGLQKITSEPEFLRFTTTNREQFGPHRSMKPKDSTFWIEGAKTTVLITVISEFALVTREETFTYIVTDASCRMRNYSFKRIVEDPDIERAEAEIAAFHKLVDTGKFHEIYTAATPSFKSVTPEAEFTALLARIPKEHGKHLSSVHSVATSDPLVGANKIEMTMLSDFARGKAKEVFLFIATPNACILNGYRIGPVQD
jgi:hypothetical protein